MPEVAAIRGDFQRDSLAQAVQYLASSNPSGRLELSGPAGQAIIYIANGNIIAASCGIYSGEKAVMDALNWESGQFVFYRETINPASFPSASLINKPITNLLLKAVTIHEEAPEAAPAIKVSLTPNSVLVLRPPQAGQSVQLDTRMLALMPHISGQRSVQEIAQVLGLPLETVLAQVATLAGQGLVEVVHQVKKVPRELLDGIGRLMVQLMGPFGEVLIDDAAAENEIDLEQLDATNAKKLALALDAKVSKERQAQYRTTVTQLLSKYGIA